MFPLHFAARSGLKLLCLGAHADDIEIGCGGTVLRLIEECTEISVTWVVFSADEERAAEAKASAAEILGRAAQADVQVHSFSDGLFPSEVEAIKARFEMLKAFAPDLILTHTRSDAHQDHRLIADLTGQTFRHHTVMGYEIPKVDGDLGNPNLFVPLEARFAERKVDLLMRHFATQRDRHWFDPKLFHAVMRLRGMHAVALSGLAEAFYCDKLVVSEAT